MDLFYIIVLIVILQRAVELLIAKRNERWLISNGAFEFGKGHYRFIVLLHVLFFISMFFEYNFSDRLTQFNVINYLFLVFFVFLQLMRIWVLKTLGKYWNTKILRIPGSELIRSGPYRFFRHPNYIIVVCEIFTIPLIFNLYYTAIVFSVLNAIMLSVRIKEENKALNN